MISETTKSMLLSLVKNFYGDQDSIDQFLNAIICFNKNYRNFKNRSHCFKVKVKKLIKWQFGENAKFVWLFVTSNAQRV